MNLRERQEKLEREILSDRASLSLTTLGRQYPEPPCTIRTAYQRDRDRILHSKAFRRLKHKTQVFLSPEGDHYRTRLTHTLEVSQISRTISRALQLNEDLTEAIALGHDLGHTPFGHCGEEELNRIHQPEGFKHNEQSLRVVEYIESSQNRPYKGLNLTYEVRDGIKNHTGEEMPSTLEGQVVRISDRIAYINHDIDDAIRAGVLKLSDLPSESLRFLGESHSLRINRMILDLIDHSRDTAQITMSDETAHHMDVLRTFMFDRVYLDAQAKKEEGKARHIIRALYYHFKINPGDMGFQEDRDEPVQNLVRDYLAGMTDRYAVKKYMEIFVPEFWK
ncbi:MAG: deoxyguanosinetriphosphate triphosphohydrolase [delta proteobacterium ML8_F1]|nr:MAG: deoxyguanosinetriphosphate triphosphohydrolase [delta proteobacterium ML8_F1]